MSTQSPRSTSRSSRNNSQLGNRPGSQASGRFSRSSNQPPSSPSQAMHDKSMTPEEERHNIEAEYADDDLPSKNYQELRQLKKAAVEEMDFDKSNSLQRYIDLKTLDNSDQVLSNFKQYLHDTISDCFNNYDSCLDDVNDEAEERELIIRQETQRVLESMEKRHVKEITDLETERSISVLREENRTSAEYKRTSAQAKRLAAADDVIAAKALKAKAEELNKQQQEQRIDEENKKFDKLLQKLNQQQKNELIVLQTKLCTSLSDAEEMHQQEIKSLQKKVGVFIRHILQKSIVEASKQLKKKEMRNKVGNELTKYVTSMLRQENKEFFLEVGE